MIFRVIDRIKTYIRISTGVSLKKGMKVKTHILIPLSNIKFHMSPNLTTGQD